MIPDAADPQDDTFISLVAAHQIRRNRERNAMLRIALGREPDTEHSHLVGQLRLVLANKAAAEIFSAAVDRQLNLINIKRAEVRQLRAAAEEAEDAEERVELAEAAREKLLELEELVQALEDVGEA